jgi:hypothetical protein
MENVKKEEKLPCNKKKVSLLIAIYYFLLFTSQAAVRMDSSDPLATDAEQEGAKASGGEPDGNGGRSVDCDSGGGADKSVESLEIRIKRYLSLSKNCNSKANVKMEKSSSMCDTIYSVRVGMLDAPGLHGGTSSIAKDDIGSFRPLGEAWGGGLPMKRKFSAKKRW